MTMALLSEDFHNKMKIILSSPVYKTFTTDQTSRIERQTVSLTNNAEMAQDWSKKLTLHALVPPKLCGLPKTHKQDVPLRPTLHCISTPTYGLPKHFRGLVCPLVRESERTDIWIITTSIHPKIV
jgi:hypothetical protein